MNSNVDLEAQQAVQLRAGVFCSLLPPFHARSANALDEEEGGSETHEMITLQPQTSGNALSADQDVDNKAAARERSIALLGEGTV